MVSLPLRRSLPICSRLAYTARCTKGGAQFMKEGMVLTWFLFMNFWLHDKVAIDWWIDCRTMTDHSLQKGPTRAHKMDVRTEGKQTETLIDTRE